MLIHQKLPQGHIYPQITHAPNTYADFLNEETLRSDARSCL
jgi:hypothetical protein